MPEVRRMLGVDVQEMPVSQKPEREMPELEMPEFGWKARVPLSNGRLDRTEVDMRWGGLLVEAKLTESDFQNCHSMVIEPYRDLDAVFERELLPKVPIPIGRAKASAEFPEDYSQEEIIVAADEWQPQNSEIQREFISGYASYQLIRNVLAAYAQNASFCVIHDARRPDLRCDRLHRPFDRRALAGCLRPVSAAADGYPAAGGRVRAIRPARPSQLTRSHWRLDPALSSQAGE